MPKMSYEGLVGAVIALVVVILDQAGIKNPYVLWGAFALAAALCLDAALRSEWQRRKRAWGSAIVLLAFGVFAFYLIHQLHKNPTLADSEKKELGEKRELPNPKPVPVAPISRAVEPKTAQPSIVKSSPPVRIEQHGDASGAVGGSINTGPCSSVQVGGNNNHSSVNCAPLATIQSVTFEGTVICERKVDAPIYDMRFVSLSMSEDATLSGHGRKATLDAVSPVRRHLTDNKTQVVITETFNLHPGSDLIGQPLSALSFIEAAEVKFTWSRTSDICSSVDEVTLGVFVNGALLWSERRVGVEPVPGGADSNSVVPSITIPAPQNLMGKIATLGKN